ncbi:uncharacterized protein LOC115771674 [Drosophila novamexicana]|uniref:uncharacterized protein LOC115771674 n=1 Tax=Drosophila novamexicana TaxID=47314 RepID=UPI0011E58D4F|nr:uncharacterized protein LOC115771674 [Drosophila novamexicana]
MIKDETNHDEHVFLIFLGLLALSSATNLYTEAEESTSDPTDTTTAPEVCLYERQPWATVNPSQYYICVDNKPKITNCNEGYYFVKNATLSGCIPAKKMDPNCVNLDVTVGPCTGINLKQPQASQVLTNFWLCTEENAAPVELTCLDDKAFVKQEGYLGCFDWALWRALRGCN